MKQRVEDKQPRQGECKSRKRAGQQSGSISKISTIRGWEDECRIWAGGWLLQSSRMFDEWQNSTCFLYNA